MNHETISSLHCFLMHGVLSHKRTKITLKWENQIQVSMPSKRPNILCKLRLMREGGSEHSLIFSTILLSCWEDDLGEQTRWKVSNYSTSSILQTCSAAKSFQVPIHLQRQTSQIIKHLSRGHPTFSGFEKTQTGGLKSADVQLSWWSVRLEEA